MSTPSGPYHRATNTPSYYDTKKHVTVAQAAAATKFSAHYFRHTVAPSFKLTRYFDPNGREFYNRDEAKTVFAKIRENRDENGLLKRGVIERPRRIKARKSARKSMRRITTPSETTGNGKAPVRNGGIVVSVTPENIKRLMNAGIRVEFKLT